MTDKKGLTTFQLKVFACLVMVIDHVSAIFMPFYDPMDSSTWPWAFALNNDILRGIGRLALPIFAFLIAEGCRHTRSLPRYCGRLFGFAVLSMVPYCFALFSQNLYTPRLVGDPSWYDEFLGTPPIWFFPDHVGNVLFSLAIGAAAVWLWNKLRPRIRGLVWIVLALYYAASLVIGMAFSVEYAEIIRAACARALPAPQPPRPVPVAGGNDDRILSGLCRMERHGAGMGTAARTALGRPATLGRTAQRGLFVHCMGLPRCDPGRAL